MKEKRPDRPKPVNLPRRILVVDDHPVVRHGMSALFTAQSDLTVAAEAGDAHAAAKAARSGELDAAIVDISLGAQSGLDVVRDLVVRCPGLPVLVLSMLPEEVWAERALAAGARGYVMKTESSAAILAAVRKVLDGSVALSARQSERMLQGLVGTSPPAGVPPVSRLSLREVDVLGQLGQGYSTAETADRLCISIKTVETHRERIKDKLGLSNAAELLRFAIEWNRKP